MIGNSRLVPIFFALVNQMHICRIALCFRIYLTMRSCLVFLYGCVLCVYVHCKCTVWGGPIQPSQQNVYTQFVANTVCACCSVNTQFDKKSKHIKGLLNRMQLIRVEGENNDNAHKDLMEASRVLRRIHLWWAVVKRFLRVLLQFMVLRFSHFELWYSGTSRTKINNKNFNSMHYLFVEKYQYLKTTWLSFRWYHILKNQ